MLHVLRLEPQKIQPPPPLPLCVRRNGYANWLPGTCLRAAATRRAPLQGESAVLAPAGGLPAACLPESDRDSPVHWPGCSHTYMTFPLFDLPPTAVELVLGSVSGLEDKCALRLVSKRCCGIVDRAVVAVNHGSTQLQLSTLTGASWRLLRLKLGYCGLDASAAATLAAADWPGLQSISLHGSLHAAGAASLASANWPALQELELASTGIGAEGAAALAAANWPNLRRLNLSCIKLGDGGAASLATAHWPRLQELRLDWNGVGAGGAAALAADEWSSLRELDLSANHLCDTSAAALASAHWPMLQELSLSSETEVSTTRMSSVGMVALAAARWPDLEKLHLAGHDVGNEGAQALADGKWPALNELNLATSMSGYPTYQAHNPVSCMDETGVAALAAAGWPALQSLSLAGQNLGGYGVYALEGWPSLRDLDLSYTGASRLEAADLRALLKVDLPAIHTLRLLGGPLGAEDAAFLVSRAAATWPSLRELHLSHSETWIWDGADSYLRMGGFQVLEALADAKTWPNLTLIFDGPY